MSDNGARAFPTQLAVSCGFCCGTNDVNWFCKSCPGSLCNTCKMTHPSILMFKNHIVVPHTSDVMRLHGPSKIAEQCRLHPVEEISLDCIHGQVPCCVTRQVQKLKEHENSTIGDANLSAENMLNDRVKELENVVMSTSDEMSDKAISMINIEKLESFSSEIKATSITAVSDNTAWVMHFKSDTMYLYDDSGKVVRSVTVRESNGIRNMVTTRSREMIVTCCDRKIRCVSVSGEVSTLIDTSPFQPCGICLTDNDDIVVCMSEQNEKNHVAVFSRDTDRKLREIRRMGGQGKQQITYPYHVVSNGRDLCVLNWNPNHVVYVDERGHVRWVYDGKEAHLIKTFHPYGISVDKCNNLLVIDIYNACVHYIDREGMLLKIILTEKQTGLSRPWGICVDDMTGRVWIGNIFKDIVICTYLSW